MSILANITVVDTDLSNVKGDISNYLFTGQSDFATEITAAKRKIYRLLKKEYSNQYPSYTDAELESKLANIKDYPSEYIKDAVVNQTLTDIMLANEMKELVIFYKDITKAIPLIFYVDDDTDSVIDESEEMYAPVATFGR